MSDYLNDSCGRVRAIHGTLWSSNDFDAIDVAGSQVGKIEISSGVVHLHAVYEKEIRILSAAARINACRPASAARVGDGHAGNVPQYFIRRRRLLSGDFLTIENCGGNAKHVERNFESRGGDDQIFGLSGDVDRQR